MGSIPHSLSATLALLLATGVTAAQSQEPNPEEIATAVDEVGFVATVIASLAVLVVSVVIAALLIHLGTGFTRSTEQYVRTEPVESGLIGFGLSIGVLVASFVLILTLIGALVGVPLFFAYLIVFLAGQVIAQIAIGHLVLREVGGGAESPPSIKTLWIAFVVGTVAVFVLTFVPYVGTLVNLAVGSLGVGAMVQHYRKGDATAESGEAFGADAELGSTASATEPETWGETDRNWDSTDDADAGWDSAGSAADSWDSAEERSEADDDPRRDDDSW